MMFSMIDGVTIKEIKQYADERGWLMDVGELGRPVIGLRHHGVANGLHIHEHLTEWMVVLSGTVRLCLLDCRNGEKRVVKWRYRADPFIQTSFGQSPTAGIYQEIVMGDRFPLAVKVPPGVAHGYKVVQGAAIMLYLASLPYNPEDEGQFLGESDSAHSLMWHREIEVR